MSSAPFAELHERRRTLVLVLRECVAALERATTHDELTLVAVITREALELLDGSEAEQRSRVGLQSRIDGLRGGIDRARVELRDFVDDFSSTKPIEETLRATIEADDDARDPE